MNSELNKWLVDFSSDADSTDLFRDRGDDHVPLMALGLIGEMGDILTEIKKEERDKSSSSGLKERMEEEMGDFLWYYVRIVSVLDKKLITELPLIQRSGKIAGNGNLINDSISLSVYVGKLINRVLELSSGNKGNFKKELIDIWNGLNLIASYKGISLKDVARNNIEKRHDRWKAEEIAVSLFDENFPPEEQLPRKLDLEFIERVGNNGKPRVILTICGIHIGDSLTDNSSLQDEYRYHDIFHLGYMAYLGWSPVFREILRCKRKSDSDMDENQDGARAVITEEAISAMVFRRAQELNYLEGVKTIEYNLLKTIRLLVKGLEVEAVPLGQWERSILYSYRIFRELKKNKGGKIHLDLVKREMSYFGSTQS